MHKLMVTAHRASANLHIHIPHYTHNGLLTHFIPFMSKIDCEQSLFLSDGEREARETGNRAQSASERKRGTNERKRKLSLVHASLLLARASRSISGLSRFALAIRKKDGLLAVYE